MRVLFVSGIDGFCHRYQVLHRAGQLALYGIESTIRHFADPRLPDEASCHDLLFVYRTPASDLVEAVLERARSAGRPIVGSIDDLIFLPGEDDCLPPFVNQLEPAQRRLWLDGVARYRAVLERCDAFVAPTEPLREAAAALGWRAYLHRNALSVAELALSSRARAARERGQITRRESDHVTLGYLSGTPTHDRDFGEIAPEVLDLMRRRPGVHLRIVGPLALGDGFVEVADRIERRPVVPWTELWDLIASLDINLAPLEWRHRLAAAKGEIKYLEAAAVAVPTIASPNNAYRHAITDRVNGRLAIDRAAWRAALEDLVADADLRARLGRAALEDVRSRYSPANRAEELFKQLREILTDSRELVSTAQLASTPQSSPASRSAPSSAVERASCVALEPDALPDLAGEPSAISPPLGDGVSLEQSFRLRTNGFYRLDLHTVTYGQALDHQLTLRLRREGGRLIAASDVYAGQVPDRAWIALEFQPEEGSAGEHYALEVSAIGGGPGNALSFGLAGTGEGAAADLPARLGGESLGRPLALRLFSAWRLAVPELQAGDLEPRPAVVPPQPQSGAARE